MDTPQLVSHHLCPYVQRVAIAYAEKGAAFERISVDLANRPAWFAAISPLGKVPLLKVGDAVIFESAAILEYLEDTLAPRLHPADPLARADHRAWVEFGSAVLNTIWGFYSAADERTFESKCAALAAQFHRVEQRLKAGPWFDGDDFSLVDAAFGPVFRYFDAFDEVADFGILAGNPKVARWRAALAGRASVRNAVAADFAERLRAFLRSRESHLGRMMRGTRPDNAGHQDLPPSPSATNRASSDADS
jgi:glutathione S-transferase